MASTTTFSTMLNQYLPEKLLLEELKKRNWALQNIEMDNSWLGGNLIIPFLGAVASTVTFGSLAASNDIAEETAVRGSITAYKEVWSSLYFNHTDIMQHDKLSEQNFLKIIPDAIERNMDWLSGMVSQNLLTGTFLCKATASGDNSGNITVGQPDRFQIGQKVNVIDDDTTVASGYVRTINMNTGVINVYSARSGGSAVDLSSFTTGQNAKIYNDGQATNGFTSLRDQLLSLANGGSTNMFGQAKTAYPFLQAINVLGSDITAANILSKIFDAFVTIRRLGGGKPTKCVMSYKHFGSVLKNLEAGKGAFNVKPMDSKAKAYGWDEVEIGGFAGVLSCVAVQEMDDDIIYFLDLSAVKFYSNGGIRRRKNPDGREFYETRATTGYYYIVDNCLFGDLVVKEPKKCGILYSISY